MKNSDSKRLFFNCVTDADSDPVSGVYVVNDRYVHLPGYQFIIKEPRLAVFTG